MKSLNLQIKEILNSKDIDYIYVETAKVCDCIIRNCLQYDSAYVDSVVNSVKIIEEAMKINDIVIIKDILRYELINSINEEE